jgi:peptide/nickel transport system permease protein
LSLLAELWRGVRRSRAALSGLAIIALVIAVALFAPWIAPYDPVDTDLRARLQPMSWEHLLGTDQLGRDIFSRLVFGARLSLLLSLGAVALGSTSGVVVGVVVGYVGGWADALFMRLVDILLAFRLLLLAITIMAILGPSLTNTIVAIGLSLFASFARLARAEAIQGKSKEYVEAAHALGVGSLRIIFRYVLPNIVAPLIILSTLTLGTAILAESALSFLGLGPSPPTPSWGLMVKEGLDQLRSAWWTSTIPGIAILVIVLGFNLLGDGLRDALDPRIKGVD